MVSQETLDFIRQHRNDDVRQLALQGGKLPGGDLTYALEQIAGWQKARVKLPTWAATDGIVYPPHLSLEQCSSEQTARYKAEIAGTGQRFVDLTGGFGVDFFFIARQFDKAVYVERQVQLCEIASSNFQLLGLQATVVNGDGADYLHESDHADLIFIDPARRDAHGGRTYGIADCTPNVLSLMDELLQKSARVLIKLSPMLDWRKAVADLQTAHSSSPIAQTVHIVSVDNECKELLILVEGKERAAADDALRVVCVNLLSDGTREHFEFNASSTFLPPPFTLHPSPSSLHPLPSTLYVPNASIMKAGCFELLAQRFTVSQLDANSHLFVSDQSVDGFPGRAFAVDKVTTLNKRELKAALSGITHANIAVRNFPMSVAELRKRLKLRDGGNVFIFATTVANQGHLLFLCRKKS